MHAKAGESFSYIETLINNKKYNLITTLLSVNILSYTYITFVFKNPMHHGILYFRYKYRFLQVLQYFLFKIFLCKNIWILNINKNVLSCVRFFFTDKPFTKTVLCPSFFLFFLKICKKHIWADFYYYTSSVFYKWGTVHLGMNLYRRIKVQSQ